MLNKSGGTGKCCRKRFIVLNTYDLLRMRRRLKMATFDMIEARLVKVEVKSGLPVASILLAEDGSCPFLIVGLSMDERNSLRLNCGPNEGGGVFKCQISLDRPSSCRNYPSEDYLEGISRHQEIIEMIRASKILSERNNKFALGQIRNTLSAILYNFDSIFKIKRAGEELFKEEEIMSVIKGAVKCFIGSVIKKYDARNKIRGVQLELFERVV